MNLKSCLLGFKFLTTIANYVWKEEEKSNAQIIFCFMSIPKLPLNLNLLHLPSHLNYIEYWFEYLKNKKFAPALKIASHNCIHIDRKISVKILSNVLYMPMPI